MLLKATKVLFQLFAYSGTVYLIERGLAEEFALDGETERTNPALNPKQVSDMQ